MKEAFVVMLVVGLVGAGCGGEPGGDGSSGGDLLAASPGVERADPVPDAPIADLVIGLNDAGFELWRRQPADGNLVFSPSSIGHALLMARAAADDATAAAIDAALSLPDGDAAHEAWNAVDLAMAGDADAEEQVELHLADRIWPRLGVTPGQEWVDLLAVQHGVTSEALDFRGDPEGSRRVINEWVSEQTEGLIPNLLAEGAIDDRTELILTDAVYFEAEWDRPFGKYSSVEDEFTRPDGTTVLVEFLHELELGDGRGTGDGFVGAEIPYAGGDFSMLLIVPDTGRFEEIRDRIDQDFVDTIDATFTTGPFELLMPKWETSTQLDLLGWLTDIGAAPGKYPAIGPEVFLDGGAHAAEITVDEQGTVAAAATGLTFASSGPPRPELVVDADRPFLCLIRHRPSGVVLFAGQVTDPTA